MTKMVTPINVLSNGSNIFDTDKEYIIPLYQRAYAWEDKQLIQLMEDIDDVSEEKNYYIGSLIVSNQNNKYEIVDGQQRLTSLYILLSCLGIQVKNTLTFACREKSNYSLRNIDDLIHEDRSTLDMNRIDSGMQRGITILKNELAKPKYADKSEFIDKLRKIVIFRIEVPENTDLNRYFEIMNTRGEQLEQQDILKAELMGLLKDRTDENSFAKIWDACSDMSGYVQMHFISKNNVVRKGLFGSEWNEMPRDEWDKYKDILNDCATNDIGKEYSINEIIKNGAPRNVEDCEDGEDKRVRFESIIDFPFFLIHTLKVFIVINGIHHEEASKDIIPKLLDDKKLKETFDNVFKYGVIGEKRIRDNEKDFVKKYVICLLRTRYLFDKYIIKREYANDSTDGDWSLKSLYVSGQKSKKKPYYRNSKFTNSGEWNLTNDGITRTIIMIQSAMRVSYVSPKVMHWITDVLTWLSVDNCKHIQDDIKNFSKVIEKMAKDAVKELFFDQCPDGVYKMGVNTPHIAFNYLDYLLWNGNPKKYSDFTFEFRNSVEHWYPQNPSEGTFEQWKEDVDSFGNLCIIQRNVNSRFSNMAPEAKKSTFGNMISKGSLKLRLMSELTVANQSWKDALYKKHEEQMIDILKENCELDSESK